MFALQIQRRFCPLVIKKLKIVQCERLIKFEAYRPMFGPPCLLNKLTVSHFDTAYS